MDNPFLTDIDSRAAVKGSRDPLGVQPIWTRLGRYLIGNLTTVSTSVRDFTTLLLGYYFAERLFDETGRSDDLAVFLKWEQLAAYSRAKINDDHSFRGTERVNKKLLDGTNIYLGTDSGLQILSNQKTYGLWGLYTVPARSSGLVDGEPTRLSPDAKKFVQENYLPIFSNMGIKDADAVVKKLAESRPKINLEGADKKLLIAVGKILKKHLYDGERDFYRNALLLGGPGDRTKGLQEAFAIAVESTFDLEDWQLSPSSVSHLAKLCVKNGEKGQVAAARLEKICLCEQVLAPAAAVFDFMLGSEGQTVNELARTVLEHWGDSMRDTVNANAIADFKDEMKYSGEDSESGSRWLRISGALESGKYADAMLLLIDQNRFVMNQRGGAAPWIEIKNGSLDVRFRDLATPPLPEKLEIPNYWRHSYFLDSARAIAMGLKE